MCNTPQQQTFATSESQCKDWCTSKNLNFCFWDITENDGFCSGASTCATEKSAATKYRAFYKPPRI